MSAVTSNAAISRMRCANLLAQVSDENTATVEAFLALVVAGQVRPLRWDECPVCGVPNGPHQGCACPLWRSDSPECDGSAPPPISENCTAPNTLADRDCDGTSAPFQPGDRVRWDPDPWREGVVDRYCDEHSEPRVKVINEYGAATCIAPDKLHREIGATSSGSTGLSTSGTTAKTSRDNAPVAASEASPEGRSAGEVSVCRCGGIVIRTRHRCNLMIGDRVIAWNYDQEYDGVTGTVARVVKGGVVVESAKDDEASLNPGWVGFVPYEDVSILERPVANAPQSESDPLDFDLDAATAEADCNALEALTGPGRPDWQPVPGEQVEVVEAVGSKTGPRRAIGTFVGYEEDEKDPDGERWRLVEVYGVLRRFRAVGRVAG